MNGFFMLVVAWCRAEPEELAYKWDGTESVSRFPQRVRGWARAPPARLSRGSLPRTALGYRLAKGARHLTGAASDHRPDHRQGWEVKSGTSCFEGAARWCYCVIGCAIA